VDDLVSVDAMTMNPAENPAEWVMRKAEARHFTKTCEVGIATGSGLVDEVFFEVAPISTPIPSIGIHSNYCWKSKVTCSVSATNGYANTGWTGTGSVPASGASSNTGEITLTHPNSSITWAWDFVGYNLAVEGTGSGSYTNGERVLVSAQTAGFYEWRGTLAGDLDDPQSPETSLFMPAKDGTLFPFYMFTNMYVDASMPDDSQKGDSWTTAKKTIQAAIDHVHPGGTVWVTNGVYNLGGAVPPDETKTNRICILRPITIRSVNGSDATSIIGDETQGSGRCAYMKNGCVLSGFTLTSGSAAGEIETENYGGGLFMQEGCVVESCVIVSNWADHIGGGVYLSGGGELNRSIVRGNATDVYGGGVGMSGGSVNNCLVEGNLHTLHPNDASGVYMEGGVLNNSTVIFNKIGMGVSGQGSINNSIIWGNENGDINLSAGAVNTTCSSNGVIDGRNGCITNNPQFANQSAGNFQLLETSPCLDRGDNVNAPAGEDLAGNPRIINGVVDLGAYEYLITEADDDADGLPNWWESHYFGSPTGSPAYDALCSNGVNTIRQAFIAGINPNDPNAAFVTFVEHAPDSDASIVRWDLVHGRVYSIYWTSNLTNSFTLLQSNVVWSAEGFIDQDHTSDKQGYYKIDVQLKD